MSHGYYLNKLISLLLPFWDYKWGGLQKSLWKSSMLCMGRASPTGFLWNILVPIVTLYLDWVSLRAYLLLSLVERLFNTSPVKGRRFAVVVGARQREGQGGSKALRGAAWVTWPSAKGHPLATAGPLFPFQDSHSERHPFLPQWWQDLFLCSSASTHSRFWSLNGFTLHWSWHRCHLPL